MTPLLADTLWMLAATALALALPAGLVLVERASRHSAAAAHGAPRVLLDLAIAVLATWVFGYAWVHGPSLAGLVGLSPGPAALADDQAAWRAAIVLWHAVAVGGAVAVAGGGGSERARPVASMLAAVLVAGVVLPLVAHWAWGGRPEGVAVGWLGRLGLLDHGGAVVLHVGAGAAGLALAAVLGPRRGRFDGNGDPAPLRTGDAWLEALGTLLVVGGCLGMIGAGRLGWRPEVVVGLSNGVVGAAAGLVAAAAASALHTGRAGPRVLRLGAVAGVVSVSAGALVGGAAWALVAGAVGGALAPAVDRAVLRSRLDDALGLAAAHLVPGAWGALAAAVVVASPGLPARLLVQALGALVVAGCAFGLVYGVLGAVDRRLPLRLSPFSEEVGSGIMQVVLAPLDRLSPAIGRARRGSEEG